MDEGIDRTASLASGACLPSPDIYACLNAVAKSIELDARGLEPPEPLVRVLAALDTLSTGDRLLLKIDCQPRPLYRILDRKGYAYDERPGNESLFEITIWSREGA
jgi:TusA-related sulfurtransferase